MYFLKKSVLYKWECNIFIYSTYECESFVNLSPWHLIPIHWNEQYRGISELSRGGGMFKYPRAHLAWSKCRERNSWNLPPDGISEYWIRRTFQQASGLVVRRQLFSNERGGGDMISLCTVNVRSICLWTYGQFTWQARAWKSKRSLFYVRCPFSRFERRCLTGQHNKHVGAHCRKPREVLENRCPPFRSPPRAYAAMNSIVGMCNDRNASCCNRIKDLRVIRETYTHEK